jgi:two-component system NtrC family sensor kinase
MQDPINWRILLIDDEEDIRDVISLVLRDAAYTVESAADGVAGLEMVGRFNPHIVITDIRMPRMDGLALLKEVKSLHPATEVIVATAFAEMALAVKALQLDASDFITKPIDNDALMVALSRARQRYLDRKKLEDYTHFLERGWDETTLELMEIYEYQRKLIESSMDGILGCNAVNRIVTFNRSMEKMTGYHRSDVAGTMSLSTLFGPEAAAAFQHDLKEDQFGSPGQLFLYETVIVTKSGNEVPVQLSATRIEENGKSEGLVCFIRDLRMLRRLEQEMANQAQILHQDKMMSLGRLAASVAHEINNPLSGILNYLRLMAKMLKRDQQAGSVLPQFSRYLETATQETDRCAQIVASLLTFSRKSSNQSSALSIQELMRRSVQLSRHRLELGHIQLHLDIENSPMTTMGDMNQLQQCIINLIFNAIDAMPDGGHLKLSAHPIRDRNQIRIVVEDTGCGITPGDRSRVFEPFFTTKAEGHGVGLGLSTTFGIIQRHGGEIQVQSDPGKGSTFSIHLKAAPCPGDNQ